MSLVLGGVVVLEDHQGFIGYTCVAFGVALSAMAFSFVEAARVPPIRQEPGIGGPLIVIPVAENALYLAIGLTGMSIFSLLLGAQILIWMADGDGAPKRLLGALAVIACGIILLFFLPQAWKRAVQSGDPPWVLSRDGLTVAGLADAPTTFRWDEITELNVVEYYGNSRGLVLHASGDSVARRTPRWLRRRYGERAQLHIPIDFFGVDAEEVQGTVLRYRDDEAARRELGQRTETGYPDWRRGG